MKRQKRESSRQRSKPCPVCYLPMSIERHEKGAIYKRARTYWVCNEKYCGHKELEESTRERFIRTGIIIDDSLQINED